MKKLIHDNPVVVKTAELFRSRKLRELQEEAKQPQTYLHYWFMYDKVEKWLKEEATIDELYKNRKKTISEIAGILYDRERSN